VVYSGPYSLVPTNSTLKALLPSQPLTLSAILTVNGTVHMDAPPSSVAVTWSLVSLSPTPGAEVPLPSAGTPRLQSYLPPFTLRPSAEYRLGVRATLGLGGEAAVAYMAVVTAACPAMGTVTVLPSSGAAGVTK
jgi:hypothetical protein